LIALWEKYIVAKLRQKAQLTEAIYIYKKGDRFRSYPSRNKTFCVSPRRMKIFTTD